MILSAMRSVTKELMCINFWQDVSAALSKKYPQLYKEGIHNAFFNWKVVGTLACFSVYQSVIVYHFTVASSTTGLNSAGKILGLWDISSAAFTCLVITVNLRLLMMCNTVTRWHSISVVGSILAWFIFIFIYSLVFVNKVCICSSFLTLFMITIAYG